MQRAVIAIGVTAVGVVALVAYHPNDRSAVALSGGALGSLSGSAPSATAPAGSAPSATAPAGSTPSSSSAPAQTAARTATGSTVQTDYGPVQVKVTLQGNQITAVDAVQLPTGGRSSEISNYAFPQLQQEALSAQSAQVNGVSGATFTSDAFAQSLQAALAALGR